MKRELKTNKRKRSEQLQINVVKMLKSMSNEEGSHWLKLGVIADKFGITQNYALKLTKAYRDEARATNA